MTEKDSRIGTQAEGWRLGTVPYRKLLAIARKRAHHRDEAEDLVQDALLEAVRQGREDLSQPQNVRWIAGIMRNRVRMAARRAVRARSRDGAWLALQAHVAMPQPPASPEAILEGLPRALKAVAALVLTGHDRREIAYLLRLSDTALRQRVVALKRHLAGRGVDMPQGSTGLKLDLPYGRIRKTLLPELLRHGGVFATHDPDGHLFIVKDSQNPRRRQHRA